MLLTSRYRNPRQSYNTTEKCVVRVQHTLGHTTEVVTKLIRGILSTFVIDSISEFPTFRIINRQSVDDAFFQYVISFSTHIVGMDSKS